MLISAPAIIGNYFIATPIAQGSSTEDLTKASNTYKAFASTDLSPGPLVERESLECVVGAGQHDKERAVGTEDSNIEESTGADTAVSIIEEGLSDGNDTGSESMDTSKSPSPSLPSSLILQAHTSKTNYLFYFLMHTLLAVHTNHAKNGTSEEAQETQFGVFPATTASDMGIPRTSKNVKGKD